MTVNLQLDDRYADVGAGWHDILVALHRVILAVDSNYELVALKPRYGGIKIEIEVSRDVTRFERNLLATAISCAEEATYYTCELCGEPGQARDSPRKQARISKVIRCDRCDAT